MSRSLRVMVELVVDGRPSLDISALALERFAAGTAIREHDVF